MTRPSDYWPGWFFKRLSRSYSDRLLIQYKDGPFENTVQEEIQLVLQEVRWRRALAPWLALLRSSKQMARLVMEDLHGRYRRAASKIHRGSAQTADQGAGADDNAAAPIPQGGYTGYSGGFTNPAPSGWVSPPGLVNTGSIATFEDAGVIAGEVVAYRCWILKPDGLLHSAYRDSFVWRPNEPAEGNPSKIDEGVHGFKSRLHACQYAALYEESFVERDPIVSGTVELWGEVREHERGYRAQYAAIASIDESPNYDAGKLRKLYGLNKKRKQKAAKQ